MCVCERETCPAGGLQLCGRGQWQVGLEVRGQTTDQTCGWLWGCLRPDFWRKHSFCQNDVTRQVCVVRLFETRGSISPEVVPAWPPTCPGREGAWPVSQLPRAQVLLFTEDCPHGVCLFSKWPPEGAVSLSLRVPLSPNQSHWFHWSQCLPTRLYSYRNS